MRRVGGRVGVHVADQDGDGSAGGPAFEHARDDLCPVRFRPCGSQRALARPAPVQLLLHVGFAQLQPRRAPVDDGAQAGAMALAEGRHPERAAEGVHFSTFAPSFFRSSKKPGYEMFTDSAVVIVVVPSAASPAMASDMTIRWSS